MNLQKTIAWAVHLPQPAFWPEIGARLTRKIRAFDGRWDERYRAAQEEARSWCSERAVTPAAGLERLGIDPAGLDRFEIDHREIWREADARVQRCPHKLGGAGNVAALHLLCEHLQASCVVETGVSYGWSSLAILLSLAKRPGSRLYSVDLPYIDRLAGKCVGVAVPAGLAGQWTLLRASDRMGLPRILASCGVIDLAHYDSDKSLEGRRWAYPRLWAALRPGGLLMSDDISDDMGFAEMCDRLSLAPIIIADGSKFQGILVKPAGSSTPGA